jgi:hypothetical protein
MRSGRDDTRFLANMLPTAFPPVWDAFRFIKLNLRSRQALTAENLFLRKQLALYLERNLHVPITPLG